VTISISPRLARALKSIRENDSIFRWNERNEIASVAARKKEEAPLREAPF
jgi:hypothetical protein